VQQKYRDRVSECRFPPLLVPLLRKDRGPNAAASIYGKGKPSKAFLITSVFFDIKFNFEFYSM